MEAAATARSAPVDPALAAGAVATEAVMGAVQEAGMASEFFFLIRLLITTSFSVVACTPSGKLVTFRSHLFCYLSYAVT